jgi:ABC-type uncharacterized transport system auxiliary subunit
MKRTVLLFATLLLAACATGGRDRPPAGVYDFGPPAGALGADARWSRLIVEVRAPHWFDSLTIEYRLAYDNPRQLREYASSRWAGPPARLLGLRLRQLLGARGAGGDGEPGCLLRIDLQEFAQVFDTPRTSRGVLHARVDLLDARRQRLAGQVFAVEQAAATADAAGGVAALAAAGDTLGRQLADWLAGLPATQTCLPSAR